jgi:hypothetical protein
MKLDIYEPMQRLTQLNKGELKKLGKEQANEIIESGASVNAYAYLYKIKVMIEEAMDNIKEDAISQVLKGDNNAFGVAMKVQQKPTYDYKHDSVWLDLKKQLTEREELMKSALEKHRRFDLVDKDTGEIKSVPAAIKKVTDYIKTEL